MTETVKQHFQPGDVDIEEMYLISSTGTLISLIDYLVEFNLYEYIFNNTLSGDIVISDSRNLIKFMPIIGEEFLVVRLRTPSLEDVISKTFRVYALTDRRIVADQNTQVYTLKFCSVENIVDTLSPLYSSFEGNVTDIVSYIYDNFLLSPRNFKVTGNSAELLEAGSDLALFNQTSNNIKFVSPGWTPLECINWLCSKAIPTSGTACNFLFWETNKRFYFGNLENLFSKYHSFNKVPGVYRLAAASVPGVRSRGTDDLMEKMTLIEDLSIKRSVDFLKNMYNGYLASRSISLDLINKSYENVEYDHLGAFNNYSHISGPGSSGFFKDTYRNTHNHIKFHPKQPNLFSNVIGNANEVSAQVYGNRLSNLLELTNFKMHINIPGRTDLEVGSLIEMDFPDTGPVDDKDMAYDYKDELYSGTYLVTALRHKINLLSGGRHTIVAEVVKDSVTKPKDSFEKYGGVW